MTDDLPDDAPRDGRAPRDLDPIATRLPGSSAQTGLTPGTVIDGRYTITGPGILGGMGVVYPATHRELNKPRALKVLHPYLVANVEAVARFRQEASLTMELQHPGIVRVYDFGDWAGQKYLVMEWVNGGSLREHLQRQAARQSGEARLPMTTVLPLMRALAEALAYAHGHQVIHRDLKPENILLDSDGTPKLTDFGIAKLLSPGDLTTTTARLGTAYYMAPEQLQGRSVDVRGDIYSLGVICYELLCGDLPVGRFPLPHELDPALPVTLDTLLERCLARRPNDRFRTAAEFQTGLQELERELIEAETSRRDKAEAARRRAKEDAERERREEEAARQTVEEAVRLRGQVEVAEAERIRQATSGIKPKGAVGPRTHVEEPERRAGKIERKGRADTLRRAAEVALAEQNWEAVRAAYQDLGECDSTGDYRTAVAKQVIQKIDIAIMQGSLQTAVVGLSVLEIMDVPSEIRSSLTASIALAFRQTGISANIESFSCYPPFIKGGPGGISAFNCWATVR